MILVAGDRMVDRYWFGDVNRISPEAPVPVLRVSREEERQGAAANVAANVIAMGVPCHAVYSPSSEPVLKIRGVCRNQQMLRMDFDHPQAPIERLPTTEAKIVVFSDYGKGALDNIERLIAQANEAGMDVLVDPKGYDYTRYKWSYIVKPNLDEIRVVLGGWKSEADLEKKAQELRKRSHISALLLTRAAEGMTLYDDSGAHHIAANAKEIYDVTGAGDTAIAALAVAIHRGSNPLEAAFYANRAAGIAVGHFGTAVVTGEEVFGA